MSEGFVRAQSDNLPKVTVIMLSDFFAQNESFNIAETRDVKADRSKREEYGDNAIGYVELKREGSICIVRGKICPEHKVRNKPYTVLLRIDEKSEEIKEVVCKDCAAAAGGCKHTIAFIMWVHRRSEEPEPTATVCYWKKPTLSQIGTNIKCITTKEMNNPQIGRNFKKSDNFFDRVLREMQRLQLNTQISRHCISLNIDRQLSLHQLLIEFADTIETDADEFLAFAKRSMSIEQCNKIADETKSQSDSKLWMEMRYGRITASRIYEVAHCKTEKGTLVEQIIGASKIKETEAMQRGKKLEKIVRNVLEQKMQVKLKDSGLLLDPEFPVIGASPDAIGSDFIVEIKCPTTLKAEQKYITAKKEICNRYVAQMQLQMLMSKMKKGYFCMAKSDFERSHEVTILVVEYNEEFIKDLIQKSMDFWKRNIFPIIYNSAIH